MSPCSFSQPTYPKKTVIEGDTLVLILPEQLSRVNLLIVNYQEQSEQLKAEQTESNNKQKLIDNQDIIIQKQDIEINLLKEKDSIQIDQISILQKQLKRHKIKTTILTALGMVGSFTLATIIFN